MLYEAAGPLLLSPNVFHKNLAEKQQSSAPGVPIRNISALASGITDYVLPPASSHLMFFPQQNSKQGKWGLYHAIHGSHP